MTGLLILLASALALLLGLLTAMLVWEMTHPPRHTAGYAFARGMAADPGEIGLAFEQWTLDRPDGARLPVWDILISRNGSSQGASSLTAIFIHGWGHSRIDALARIKPFDETCQRIIMYDLRGHGDADDTISRLGHREDEDLIALLERLGSERFILVGHSMGAVIAINAACRAKSPIRERIAGLIAYGPYVDFHVSLQGRLRSAGYPARPITDLALVALRIMGIRPLEVNLQACSKLPCPLCVIHGRNDRVVPIAHGRQIIGAAACARLHEMTGAEHADTHAIDSARHDEIVRGFFDQLRSG